LIPFLKNSLIRGIIRRLLSTILTLWVGITICFFIIRLAPGDPTTRFLTPTQSTQTRDILRTRFGLDQPLPNQYFHWLARVGLHLDFGYSFLSGKSCASIMTSALKPTAFLTGTALIIALLLGISTGALAAINTGRLTDRILRSIMMVFLSVPAFWLGLIFIGFFSIKLGWLPSAQIRSLYYDQLSPLKQWLDTGKHLILPALTLGLPLSANIYKYFRAEMINTLQSDFILAARARGINKSRIIWQYGLKNSLLPVISLIGIVIPALLSGALIIEVLFALPGIGRTMVTAVFSRDYPLIMAGVSLSFLVVVSCNLLADIICLVIDPRAQNNSGKII